ncbi:hypothetical protein RQP46_007262 [Phenoliferia psychrophenolica]
MLGQSDVVKLLSKSPPPAQHEAFQILAAYIYCKSSHGNLPTETLAKLLAIQRKLLARTSLAPTSPVGRAFEAAKTQLIAVNRRWVQDGPLAFGALGQIGSASSDDARLAWTKATDGKVTVFDDGSSERGSVAIDAGRVIVPLQDAPPLYVPPPPTEAETEAASAEVEGGSPRVEHVEGPAAVVETTIKEDDHAVASYSEFDVEAGRQTLARLRAARELKEEEERAKDAAALAREREVTTDVSQVV